MTPEFLRYSCQMVLPDFGEGAQLLLKQAKVLIVGAGGLGCPAAQYLTSTGVGTIGIADFDVIAVSNLHRQVLFGPADAGLSKAAVAIQSLQKQNPDVAFVLHEVKITSENVMEIIGQYDIIVDCTDNFETRYLLNDAGAMAETPVVYGAIYQYEGQVAVWNVLNEEGELSPNYRDLFPQVDASQIPDCSEGGVIPTLAGIIGCMQANEVIKYITKTGELLAGKLLILDAQTMQTRIIKIGGISKTPVYILKSTVQSPTISVIDLKRAISNDNVQLIDVRTAEEHDEFDLGGENIPLNKLENSIHKLNSDKKIVFYCASGKRSGEAVKLVMKQFPDADVVSLTGGLNAWEV